MCHCLVRLAALALLAVLVLSGCRTLELSPAPSHLWRCGDLEIEVMDPNHPERYNRGPRFTPVAAVLAARLGEDAFLYRPEAHNTVDDHAGLATEFDLCIPNGPDDELPPGYREAKVGEGFLKIGVGVLQKQKERYSLFQHPRILAPASTAVTWRREGADYRQVCLGTNGYAYVLAARLRLHADCITVAWELANTGTKSFTTRQYSHNFCRFAGRDVGPGYVLEFPYDFQAEGLAREQRQVGREIRFEERIPEWVNLLVRYPPGYAGPNVCRLRQPATGLELTCETSRPGLWTAIHARPGYVAPEQFIELHLVPGETAAWTRSYRFAKTAAGGTP